MAKPSQDDSDVGRMEFLLTLRRRGIADQAVLRAMDEVPRGQFVEAGFADSAYADQALPIACGQTISQPYVVAYMTEQLALRPHHRVLEVGTGSGYQAAVLAELTPHVCSIEVIPALAEQAARALAAAGYGDRVALRTGDGALGWPERAPFDGILVPAAATAVPPALVEQLRPGGRLVIPVGPTVGRQMLRLIEKHADGRVTDRPVLDVAFVPLTTPAG